MELLAYTHAATTFENPLLVERRSPDEILSALPSSTWLGVASLVVFAALMGGTESAQAALCDYGDQGSAVSELQRALQDKGYYSAQVDGVFGSLTDTGVRQFQDAAQLTVDGKAGIQTLSALGLDNKIGSVFGTGATCNAGGGGGGGSSATGVVKVVTSANPLLVRSRPSTSSQDIDAIANGTEVQFSNVATDASGTWLYADSYGGWISAKYTTYGGSGSTASAPAAVSAAEGERGRIRIDTQANPLNVRSDANASSEVLTAIAKDTLVNYSRVATSSDGTWLYLPAYGGWVSAKYTTYGAEGSGDATEGAERSGSVAVATRSEALVVRSQPSKSSLPINALAKGARVDYSRVATNSAGETWLYVPNQNGWISARYTTFNGTNSANSAAAPTTASNPAPAPTASPATNQTSPQPAPAPSPDTASAPAPSVEASQPAASPATSPVAIADETTFDVAELAQVAAGKAPLYSSPGAATAATTQLDKGTFVSYTQRATLSNGEKWYFIPSYDGWVRESDLDFISIDFTK